MRKLWVLGILMMVLFSHFSLGADEYTTGTCPTSTIPSTLLFCFFGLLLAFGFWYSDKNGSGIGLIMISILTIFFSLPLYGCGIAWGLVLTCAGLLCGIYAIKWKYY